MKNNQTSSTRVMYLVVALAVVLVVINIALTLNGLSPYDWLFEQ